jgi:hypothetical protein
MISRRQFVVGLLGTAVVSSLPTKNVRNPLGTIEEVVKKTPLVAVEGVFAISKHLLALKQSVLKYGELKAAGKLSEDEFKKLTSVEFAERAAAVLTWVASFGLDQLIQRLEVPEKVRYNLWMTINTGLIAHLNTHVYKILLQAMEKDSKIQETQNYSICQWVEKIAGVSIAERKKLSDVMPLFGACLTDLKKMPKMCKTTRGKVSNSALFLQHVLGLLPNIYLGVLRFLKTFHAQQYIGSQQIRMARGSSVEEQVTRKAGVNAGTYPMEGIINSVCAYLLKQPTLGFKDPTNEKKAKEFSSLLVSLFLFNALKTPIDAHLMSNKKTLPSVVKKLIAYCQPLK